MQGWDELCKILERIYISIFSTNLKINNFQKHFQLKKNSMNCSKLIFFIIKFIKQFSSENFQTLYYLDIISNKFYLPGS